MKILVATANEGKIKEIKEILNGIEIITFKDIKNTVEVIEDENSFKANALKKAKETYQKLLIPCIADDSGISIMEYDGWPGVKTARFLGEDKKGNEHARERNEYILNKMEKIPKSKRKVDYITAIAYYDGKQEIVVEGVLSGYIAIEPRGDNGFGFDEIFELENGKTLAELTNTEKNVISSRKKALEKIKEEIFSRI